MISVSNAKMKRNRGFMVYLKILKLPNQFKCTYHLHICFDSLNGAELRVSLNVICAGNPNGRSVTVM